MCAQLEAQLEAGTFDGGSFNVDGSPMANMTTAAETTDMIASLKSEIASLKMEMYAAEREQKCLAKCDANHVKCKSYCTSCHASSS